MPHHLDDCLHRLATAPAVLVSVGATRGSVPRETGTWMAVFAQALVGTIGGGHLEWDAIRQARDRLQQAPDHLSPWTREVVLGPSLGQCCGGALTLRFEPVTAADAPALRQRLATPLTPVALFGGLRCAGSTAATRCSPARSRPRCRPNTRTRWRARCAGFRLARGCSS
jgi:xanthine dehydrogenase accessory factor